MKSGQQGADFRDAFALQALHAVVTERYVHRDRAESLLLKNG